MTEQIRMRCTHCGVCDVCVFMRQSWRVLGKCHIFITYIVLVLKICTRAAATFGLRPKNGLAIARHMCHCRATMCVVPWRSTMWMSTMGACTLSHSVLLAYRWSAAMQFNSLHRFMKSAFCVCVKRTVSNDIRRTTVNSIECEGHFLPITRGFGPRKGKWFSGDSRFVKKKGREGERERESGTRLRP